MIRIAFGCLALLVTVLPTAGVSARIASSDVLLDATGVVREYYGVPLNLALKRVATLPFKSKLGREMGEGSYYPIAIITARKGVKVKASFGRDGRLFRFETSTPDALGLRGLKIGSTLAELKRAYPERRPYWGVTPHDEYFATFGTGTKLTFHFSPFDLPKEAWSHNPKEYELPPSIKVKSIKISPINAF